MHMQGGEEEQPIGGKSPEAFQSEAPSDDTVIAWEASEYIHHQKDSSWYLGFAGIMLIVIAVLFFLIRDVFSVIVLCLMAIAVAVYAGRKPSTIRYSLNQTGLSIGDKQYDFDNYSSFSLLQEGAITGVMLMPVKRFMPPVSIYFSPEDAPHITEILAAVLPHEEREPDFIDKFMRNIRF